MPQTDLSRLVESARGGGVNAFCDLVLATQEDLRAYVARLGVRGAAVETIAQDAFVTAWRRFVDFRPGADFPIWMRGIARNLVRRHFSGLADAPTGELADLLDADPAAAPAVTAPVDLLRGCLERLAVRARELIRLRYYQEQDAGQIGKTLGMEAAAVRVALQRARGQLRACVESRLAGEVRS